MSETSRERRRTAVAPPPSPASANLPPNRVLSVVLAPDEDVEWEWTTRGGVSYVSGYSIAKREAREGNVDSREGRG
jgi:hypothetical protein